MVEAIRLALNAKSPPETLPEELAGIPEICALYQELLELREFMMGIAGGDLSRHLSMKGYIAGALKMLQANLKHITWQTKMIAEGDFSQRLDFMGEFSAAFNYMTEQMQEAVRTIQHRENELNTINTGLLLEIERRKKIQKALEQSEAHYRNLTEMMKDVVFIIDVESLRFVYISPSVQGFLGFDPDEVLEYSVLNLMPPKSRALLRTTLGKRLLAIERGEKGADDFFTTEIEVSTKQGVGIWVEVIVRYVANPQTGYLEMHGSARDITERRAMQLKLHHQATIDELTGASNRRYFLECLGKEMQRAKRHDLALAYLMVDLDHFKRVNDTFGHAVGDQALRAMAQTCREILRTSDGLGRLGGEEFALYLVETDLQRALVVAERLRRAVEQIKLVTDTGEPVLLRVSIGVTEYRRDSDTLSSLMIRADQNLYRAKQSGRNRVESSA